MTEKTDIRDSDEKVVEIEMERLRNFTNHPFKVIGDSQMIELQDSIKKYGVLNPLIVRPRKEGYYEIISGHRRKYVAERLGYKKIPVIIRMMQADVIQCLANTFLIQITEWVIRIFPNKFSINIVDIQQFTDSKKLSGVRL